MKKLLFFLLASFSLFADDHKEAKRGANIALKMMQKKITEQSTCKIDKNSCLLCSVLVNEVELELLNHPEIFTPKPSQPLPESIIKKIENESFLCRDKNSKECLIFKKFVQEKFNKFDGSAEEFEKMVDDFLKTISSKIKKQKATENK